MKKILIIAFCFPFISICQIENKIEGLILNTPCELEYTRNLGNENNYSCVSQDENQKVFQYSVTVQNLFNEMNGLDGNALQAFKDQFLKTANDDAKRNGEVVESITLKNGQKALKTKSSLDYSGQKFIVTSIVFLYKQKSFIVNLVTNNLNNQTNLSSLIKIN